MGSTSTDMVDGVNGCVSLNLNTTFLLNWKVCNLQFSRLPLGLKFDRAGRFL